MKQQLCLSGSKLRRFVLGWLSNFKSEIERSDAKVLVGLPPFTFTVRWGEENVKKEEKDVATCDVAFVLHCEHKHKFL